MVAQKKVKRDSFRIPTNIKYSILTAGLAAQVNGRIPTAEMNRIAEKYDVTTRAVYRVMTVYKEQKDRPDGVIDLSPKARATNTPSMLTDEVKDNILAILKKHNGVISYRHLAVVYEMMYGVKFSHITLWKYLKAMGVQEKTSRVKPSLTVKHKVDRLKFVLSKIKTVGRKHFFHRQLNHIHIDEKWFYALREGKKCKFIPGCSRYEDDTVTHKNMIGKVMFLSAIGVPQRVPVGNKTHHDFDGKLGTWGFFEETPAKRSSKNRPKGTLEVKSVSVTSEVYLNMIRDNVIPAVKEKMFWLKDSRNFITIQHDGARSHTGCGNMEKLNTAGIEEPGWKIRFETQPAQSPDLNKNDLCFFASLQKRAEEIKTGKSNIDIINSVVKAYNDYPVDVLQRVDAAAYVAMREILKNGGGNQYDMPHTGVRTRQAKNKDSTVDYNVPHDMFIYAKHQLNELSKLL